MIIYRIITLLMTTTTLCLVFWGTPLVKNLGPSTRILYLHVPAAFLSISAFILSGIYAYKYLKTNKINNAIIFDLTSKTGFILLITAIFSGALWSKIYWGTFWNWDPRQTTITVLFLIYLAYMALRYQLKESNKKDRLSAIYLIYAACISPFLFFIVPRLYNSLHPQPIINKNGMINLDIKIGLTLIMAIFSYTLILYDIFLLRYNYSKKSTNR